MTKIRTPYDRDDLRIKLSDRVIEIGSGHSPSYRANVIVEKFIANNYHRGGSVKVYPHQQFVNADGECLPFKDKEFDYAICAQVLEHVEHPELFVKEQSRVARRGYIETPSLVGEHVFPKGSHKWVILDIDGKLVMYEKAKMEANWKNDYAQLFLNYFPYQSLPLRLLGLMEEIFMNRYEWEDEIEILVNPQDDKYLRFFTQPWDADMIRQLFPPRSISSEWIRMLKVLVHLMKYEVKHKWKKHPQPLPLEEYLAMISR